MARDVTLGNVICTTHHVVSRYTSDAGTVKHSKRDEWARDQKAKIRAKEEEKFSAALVSAGLVHKPSYPEAQRIVIVGAGNAALSHQVVKEVVQTFEREWLPSGLKLPLRDLFNPYVVTDHLTGHVRIQAHDPVSGHW